MKKLISLLTVFFLSYAAAICQPCIIPDSFFQDDTIVVCQGSIYQLDAPDITGAQYTWSTTATTRNTNITVNGKYWLTISDANCSKTDTVVVLFNSFLLSPVVNDLKLCKGQPALPLQVIGQQLRWYEGPVGGTANTTMPRPSTADTGRHTYWFSQTIRGCESPRLPVLVRVIDKPKFELGDAFIIPCNSLGITLQVVADGESEYTWSNGSNEVAIVASQRGRYSLYAENMCGNHADTTVAVECQDRCVQFPTAFTPNADGKNDNYQPACFCPVPTYKLLIYNRNGELVFKTTDPSSGWSGYYNGKPQPNGAYVYYTEFFDFVLKQSFTQKGSFVLLR